MSKPRRSRTRHKIALQKAHEENEENAVLKLRVEVGDFEVNFVEVFIAELNQRALDMLKLVWPIVKECIEGVAFALWRDLRLLAGDGLRDYALQAAAAATRRDDERRVASHGARTLFIWRPCRW